MPKQEWTETPARRVGVKRFFERFFYFSLSIDSQVVSPASRLVVGRFQTIFGKGVKQLQNVEGRIPNAENEGAPGSPEIAIRAPLRLLTRQELAAALSLRTVDEMIAAGEIPVVRIRETVRFYLPDVVRSLTASAVTSKRGCRWDSFFA